MSEIIRKCFLKGLNRHTATILRPPWREEFLLTGVIQLIPPVLSSETLLHILLSSEYSGFRPSTTAVVTQTVHT